MNDPRAEARRWFQQAQADMAVVRTLRSAGHHAAACFHSQQAAEKALKNDRYTPNDCQLRPATNAPLVRLIFRTLQALNGKQIKTGSGT